MSIYHKHGKYVFQGKLIYAGGSPFENTFNEPNWHVGSGTLVIETSGYPTLTIEMACDLSDLHKRIKPLTDRLKKNGALVELTVDTDKRDWGIKTI